MVKIMQTSDSNIAMPSDLGLNDKHPPNVMPTDAHMRACVHTHTHTASSNAQTFHFFKHFAFITHSDHQAGAIIYLSQK